MRAPYNKPTEKTKKRLASKTLSKASELGPLEIDINTLVEKMLGSKNIQEEILRTATKRLQTKDEIDNLKAILSEYLDSFILLGYGVEGNRVIIKHTKTSKDEDSIIEMFRFVFMRMVQGE